MMGLAAPETDEERALAAKLDIAYMAGWNEARDAAIEIAERLLDHSDKQIGHAVYALIIAIQSELGDDQAK